MRLVRHHDNVIAVGQLWKLLAFFCPKLLDQREYVPVILREQLLQVLRAVGSHAFFRLRDRANAGEVLVKLIVQFVAVGDAHERPVARNLPQHLLREEHH